MVHLHPQLAEDTVEVAKLDLCRLLLMNDSRFPWLILVPDREGATELHTLSAGDQATAMKDVTRAAETLENIYAPDKINIGALGNLVPQLHIHVIARFETDPAWPGPVWGHGDPVPYGDSDRAVLVCRLRDAL